MNFDVITAFDKVYFEYRYSCYGERGVRSSDVVITDEYLSFKGSSSDFIKHLDDNFDDFIFDELIENAQFYCFKDIDGSWYVWKFSSLEKDYEEADGLLIIYEA